MIPPYKTIKKVNHLTSMLCIAAIFCAICTEILSSAISLVSKGLALMYSSILPPGKIPCSFGPNPRSDSKVNITLSVISDSRAFSPCKEPQMRIRTSLGSPWFCSSFRRHSGRETRQRRLERPPLQEEKKRWIRFERLFSFV